MEESSSTSKSVTYETVSDTEIEQRLLEFASEYRGGVTNQMIEHQMPMLRNADVVRVINMLLKRNKFDIMRKDDNTLCYKLKDPGSLLKVKGAEPEEQVIYKIIEESGKQGVWARDIRAKCNLHLNTVEKVLRKLDSKKLIKSFNSVAAPKKKTYLLYDLEPDRSLTGGPWYSEQLFDSEFVDILNEQCSRFLETRRKRDVTGGPIAERNASFASSNEVLNYITQLGFITNITLSLDDIETILETLVYDEKVQRIISGDGDKKLYRSINNFLPTSTLVCVPCGVCPLINQCGETGKITPIKCEYMKDWLDKW